MKTAAPYGSWKSPLSADMATQSSLSFSEINLVNNTIYWLEGRASEGGRVALMAWDKQQGERELLPKEYSVRSRVHEYGGGALFTTKDKIFFVRDQDQQVYSYDAAGTIHQITHQKGARFADGCYNAATQELFYVMELHAKEVINSLVKIDLATGTATEVATGNDFYSSPRVSPDGKKIAYITWNNPNMPWDTTELWVLDLATGKRELIAGGKDESVCDPKWSPEGQLYYVSDRTGWWNIYTSDHQPVWATDAEFTLPQWLFARSLICFTDNGIVSGYTKNATNYCAHIAINNNNYTVTDITLPYTTLRRIAVENNTVAMIAGSPTQPYSIITYDLTTGATHTVKRSNNLVIDQAYIPQPQTLEFPTTAGTAHAFYYPPTNAEFCGIAGEKPPLLVLSHGGPTGHVPPILHPEIIYWTSRGFAVVDVNYGGSTGYGRTYRNKLKGNWGVVDVDDCANAALYCAEQGLADKDRLLIQGGSAGGFTTLAALAAKDIFKAGANHFGVSDLERFVGDTHKFEARYLEQLVGKYPEEKAKYQERSPINNVHKISSPVIIFQGDEDAIVPPSQSEVIFDSLVARNIPTAYILYQGEQHGFRKAENIKRSFEAQLYFFAHVLNIQLSDVIEPVTIINKR